MISRIIGVCVCALLCTLVLKQYSKPFSVIVSILACLLCLSLLSDKLYELFASINDIADKIPTASSYVKLMLKTLCIILVAKFTADICRDNGESALASFTETGAKVVVIVMILPLFDTVLSLVGGLVK